MHWYNTYFIFLNLAGPIRGRQYQVLFWNCEDMFSRIIALSMHTKMSRGIQ
jgi:hypothetical protein